MAGGMPLRDASALLWEESRRQLERQEADYDSLLNRTIALLSVAAIVAGFFGSRVAHGTHDARVLGAVVGALVLFGITVAVALYVLAPKKNSWYFAHFLRKYFTKIDDGTLDPITVTDNFARHFEEYRIANKAKLEHLYVCLSVICLLVGLQVIAWGVAVV